MAGGGIEGETLGGRTPGAKAKNREATRKSILGAAVGLLSANGPQSLTMERVAKKAGLAKGTLYLYFKDKQALLESMKEEALCPLREEMAGILAGGLPPREKLESLVTRHLGYFDENRGYLKVILWQRQIVKSFEKRQHSDMYRSFVEQVAAVIQEGIRRKDFRKMEAAKAAVVFVEADIALARQRLFESPAVEPGSDAKLLLDIFFDGIMIRNSGSRRQ